MEAEHRDSINHHLEKLLSCTICGDIFLAFFRTKNIFFDEDIQKIKVAGNNHGEISKASKFYEVLMTKFGSYTFLLDALRATNQSGALELLIKTQDTGSSPSKSSKSLRFVRPPSCIAKFLDCPTKTVLIINSTDCEITCDWICETVDNCQHYSFHDFLWFISRKQNVKETKNNLSVVNCENENVGHMIRSLTHLPGKFIIVGSYEGTVIQPAHSIVNERIFWHNLSPIFSYQILQNQICSLDLNADELQAELDNLEESVLHKLIKGETPTLFRDTIPDIIPYYIPRRLLSRYIISPKIFARDGQDIFLIEGMEWHQLTELAAGKATATSSECASHVLDDGTQLVILEDLSHFSRIAEVNKQRPVHLLRYLEGRFVWFKSSERIEAIQAYGVDINQNILNEDDFVKNVIDQTNCSNDPICISDTPGMGKSMLLTHIGRNLQKEFPTDLVGYLVISELVEQTKRWNDHEDLNENVFRVISDNFCENKLGVAFLKNNNDVLKHLLLDGLDEVNASESDIQFAYKLLKLLQEILPNTRLWITTRPHMFMELEKKLNVLGYNIEAFAEVDQINFLKSFWSKDWNSASQPKAAEKLPFFAEECLKSIKSKIISEQEQDIAGIPLQCLLIGEVFMGEANNFCDNSDFVLPNFNINSVSDLYQQLMQQKFNKFRERYDRKGVEDSDLEKVHILHSIRLLFPSLEEKFSAELTTSSLSIQDILDVGIVESKNMTRIPRFIHRTFAEYFVAIFLLESLPKNWSPLKSDFLLNQVFETTQTSFSVYNKTVRIPQFRNNVICYFIDSCLGNYQKGTLAVVHQTMKVKQLQSIAAACAYGCFQDIFLTLIHSATILPKYKNKLYSENFLCVCTSRAGVKMSKCVYESYKDTKGTGITGVKMKHYTLLHFAVSVGKYSIVEHLIEKQGFKECLRDNHKDFSNLMHVCVQNSIMEDPRILNQKSQIIRYLARINNVLLTSKTENGDIPLLSFGIHVDLAKEILRDAKLTTPIHDVLIFLHKSLYAYTSEYYYHVLTHVKQEFGDNQFLNLWIQSCEGSFLLHKLLALLEPSETLLNFILCSGVNFSNSDENQESVLQTAVKGSRSSACISWLIKSVKFTESQLRSAFVTAVSLADVEIVNIFLDGEHVDANNFTTHENNMWQVLFNAETIITSKHCHVAQKLIGHGKFLNIKGIKHVDVGPIEILVSQKTTRSQEWCDLFELCFNHIHKTAASNWFTKINYFVRHDGTRGKHIHDLLTTCAAENNINKIDRHGNTLLHLIWKSVHLVELNSWKVWKILVEGGANVLALNNNKETPVWKLLVNYNSVKDRNKQLTTAFQLLRSVQIFETAKINEIVTAAVRRFSFNVVKSILEWYVSNVRLPVSTIRGNYKGMLVTLLDMTLLSRNGYMLEYLYKTHNCTWSPQPLCNTCIHKCVQGNNIPLEEKVTFITTISGIYPDLVNAKDEKGRVPLSVNIKFPQFVKHLVNLGADVNAVDPHGNTPLHWALKNYRMFDSVVKTLVECGADVNAETVNQETPLSLTLNHVNSHFNDVFIHLIENNADPGKQDTNGDTVLHQLPNKDVLQTTGFQLIVEYLLKKGYLHLFYLPNKKNLTPLQIALQRYPRDHAAICLIENCKTRDRMVN